jgi:hypothetical protein
MTFGKLGKIEQFSEGVQSNSPDPILGLAIERVGVIDGEGDDRNPRTQYPSRGDFARTEVQGPQIGRARTVR